MQDDGTLVHKNTQTVSTGVDIWVRGNFLGTSAKRDSAWYDRDTGVVNVYEVLTTGALTFRFSKTVAAGYALAFTGFWGNGACDDIVFYDRATGAARSYESDGSSTFTLAHTASWQKTWDYIVPGRFNTDGFTDLLYYNQDGGDVKVFTLDANRNGTQTYSATNWPITPFSTVTVGEFSRAPPRRTTSSSTIRGTAGIPRRPRAVRAAAAGSTRRRRAGFSPWPPPTRTGRRSGRTSPRSSSPAGAHTTSSSIRCPTTSRWRP